MLRASSLWRFSDKLLGSPASTHKLPIAVQRKKPRYSRRAGASLGPLGGNGPTLGAEGIRYQVQLIMPRVWPWKKVRKGVSNGATGYSVEELGPLGKERQTSQSPLRELTGIGDCERQDSRLTREGAMTIDPKKIREIAHLCATLSKSAPTAEEHDIFANLASKWLSIALDRETRLAIDLDRFDDDGGAPSVSIAAEGPS